jgi:hypothetical protein
MVERASQIITHIEAPRVIHLGEKIALYFDQKIQVKLLFEKELQKGTNSVFACESNSKLSEFEKNLRSLYPQLFLDDTTLARVLSNLSIMMREYLHHKSEFDNNPNHYKRVLVGIISPQVPFTSYTSIDDMEFDFSDIPIIKISTPHQKDLAILNGEVASALYGFSDRLFIGVYTGSNEHSVTDIYSHEKFHFENNLSRTQQIWHSPDTFSQVFLINIIVNLLKRFRLQFKGFNKDILVAELSELFENSDDFREEILARFLANIDVQSLDNDNLSRHFSCFVGIDGIFSTQNKQHIQIIEDLYRLYIRSIEALKIMQSKGYTKEEITTGLSCYFDGTSIKGISLAGLKNKPRGYLKIQNWGKIAAILPAKDKSTT